MHFLIDTGAIVDIIGFIDSNTFEKIEQESFVAEELKKNILYAYGFQTPLPLKGKFQATLESKKRYTVSQI